MWDCADFFDFVSNISHSPFIQIPIHGLDEMFNLVE